MSFATVSLVGNLVRPPEQIYFPSGRVKTTLVVAINMPARAGKPDAKANFYRVETWGKLAEIAGRYLSKGNQIGACGRLRLDEWTDREGRSRMTAVVEAKDLAIPPRAKLSTNGDDSSATDATNAIAGQMVFSDNPLEESFPEEEEVEAMVEVSPR